MRCTRLAENTGRKKSPKISSSGHHRTTLSGYIFATKAYIENWKKHLNSNIFSTWSHNMVNFGPLTAEIGSGVCGTPSKFQRVTSCLSYCSDIAHRRPTKLCTMSGRLLGWYTMYTLSEALAPDGILSRMQNSLCVQVLRSPILTIVYFVVFTVATICGE